jgi:hypothetical protein
VYSDTEYAYLLLLLGQKGSMEKESLENSAQGT